VVQAAETRDQVARNTLQKIGRYLGIGIASLVNALNPDLIVFGGILSLAGDFLLPTIRSEIHQRALPYLWGDQMAQVVIAQHGVDACVMGGVARCYEYILTQPGYAARQRIQ
jgi:predicted NBD/HSP70 family sugar kinase